MKNTIYAALIVISLVPMTLASATATKRTANDAEEFFRKSLVVKDVIAHSFVDVLDQSYSDRLQQRRLSYFVEGIKSCGVSSYGLECLDAPIGMTTWHSFSTIFETESDDDEVFVLIAVINSHPSLLLTVELYADPLKGAVKQANIFTYATMDSYGRQDLEEAYLEKDDWIRLFGRNRVAIDTEKRLELVVAKDPETHAWEQLNTSKNVRTLYHMGLSLYSKYKSNKAALKKLADLLRPKLSVFSEFVTDYPGRDRQYYLNSGIRLCNSLIGEGFLTIEDCLSVVEKGLNAEIEIDRDVATAFMVEHKRVTSQVMANLRDISANWGGDAPYWSIPALFKNRQGLEDDIAIIKSLGSPNASGRVIALPYVQQMILTPNHLPALKEARASYLNGSSTGDRLLKESRYYEQMEDFTKRAETG